MQNINKGDVTIEVDYKQESIMIGEIEVPVIHYDGDVWYPANYINRCLFKRPKGHRLIIKDSEYKYKTYMKSFNINYDKGGKQLSKCINKDGLSIVLKEAKIGSYDKWQKHVYNELIKQLNLNIQLLVEEEIATNENEINKIVKNYSLYIQDCINEVLKKSPKIKWRKCNRCGNIYPLHCCFFNADNRISKVEFMNFCKECGEGSSRITHVDKKLNQVYLKYGEEYFIHYKNHNTLNIYEYCNSHSIQLPSILRNKNDYLLIVKDLFTKGYINKDNLTIKMLEDNFNLKGISFKVQIHELYEFLFGKDYWEYPWGYKNLSLFKLTYEQAKIILNNYMNENNIKINNIFDFKYNELIRKAKISQIENDILSFLVYYYDYKYAGYLFNIPSTNYWKIKKNRLFDLKYFIEQDMKIPIDKIPLYITKNVFQKRSRKLYYILYNNKYYRTLFEWINEAYPNKFIESDFVIGNYRDEFDSVEENQINDILHNYFDNIIYNQINTERTINFDGKTPDWFIFTNTGCIIVEYFGLYVPSRSNSSSVIRDYIKRSDEKKKIYCKMTGYKFLYFYPEDIENDFKGVRDKIKKLMSQI